MPTKQKPWLIKRMMTLVGKKPLKKIVKATYAPKRHQEIFLNNLIKNNISTEFGRDHNFSSIKNYEDFKNNVPIREYNDFTKYLEKIFEGQEDILFKGKPALFNTSSGTTDKPKLIPISKDFQTYLKNYNKLWLYSILIQNPTVFHGKSLTSVGKSVEGYIDCGIPIGSISGNSFKNIPETIKRTYSSVYAFFAIDDYDLRYYSIARNALAQDITISICPSIANVIRYHQVILDNFDEMVEEIRTGTIRADVLEAIDKSEREDALSRVFPMPERAAELIKLKEKYGDKLLPKHYWPNLAVINAWIQGNFEILVDRIKGYFPETTVVRSFGYQASEGRFGMSLDNHWRYSVLETDHYFYEFIPFSQRDDENPDIKLYHELELGERYYIIISNPSGLYRYDMNDILEVVGFHNKAPLLRFIQKGAGIVNIMGEKLAEEQVISATKQTAAETGNIVNNYIMFGDYKNFQYEYFVEFDNPNLSLEDKNNFIKLLDKKLKDKNMEYASKRNSNRLQIPIVITMPRDSHQKIKQELVRKKLAKDGQYKDLYLSSKKATREVLKDVC